VEQQKPNNETELEQRIQALEERYALAVLPVIEEAQRHKPIHPAWPLFLGVGALVSAYLGMGLPQHYYQPLFAGLVLAAGYHRKLWTLTAGPWRWPLVVINFLVLGFLFKLLIGAGTSYPFEWMKVPAIATAPSGEDESWFSRAIPNLVITWKGIPGISDWNFDLTKLQTLLLIATLIGGLFRFQPFASFTAVILLLISIPTLVDFNWDWLIPYLVLGGTTLYLQSVRD